MAEFLCSDHVREAQDVRQEARQIALRHGRPMQLRRASVRRVDEISAP